MGDSVGFYNWGFSIMSSNKILDLLRNTKIVKGYAKTIPSNLVKECSMDEKPIGIIPYIDLIPNWFKWQKCYEIIKNE